MSRQIAAGDSASAKSRPDAPVAALSIFQYSAEDEFRQAIEEITGRGVIAFISGIDTRSDIASEIFMLEPE